MAKIIRREAGKVGNRGRRPASDSEAMGGTRRSKTGYTVLLSTIGEARRRKIKNKKRVINKFIINLYVLINLTCFFN